MTPQLPDTVLYRMLAQMLLEEVLFLWKYAPGIRINRTWDESHFCRLDRDSKFGPF